MARPDESRYAHDDKLYVEFSRDPVMHPGKSKDAGRAIYEHRDIDSHPRTRRQDVGGLPTDH